MRAYNIHHVDSFTDSMFGGNPTVAVLDADSLTDDEMKKIAREVNLSETGFLLTSQKADFRLRFFTPPGDEIKFCGHATIGVLCAIAKEGLFNCHQGSKTQLSVETNAGVLKMEIDLTKASPKFSFDAPKIDLVKAPYSLEEVIQALGISRDLIDETKPLMLEKTNNYLYFSAKSLEALGKIELDMRRAIEFAKKDRIVIFCILTGGAFDKANHLHTRGFAPLVGVPEDPFTGSMQGAVAAYAIQEGIIPTNSEWIGVEQGHFMGRPGFVKLEITKRSPIQVKLHAEAFHLFASTLALA